MTPIRGAIFDFGGVLTTPLHLAFASVQQAFGVRPEHLGLAMGSLEARDGEHPLARLETGRMSEADFLADLGEAMAEHTGAPVALHEFSEHYWSVLHANDEMVRFARDLRDRGVRMALLTNNVREWEPRWRPKWPIDEIFELVVDSGFVGMRKPDPAIYELTLERFGLPAEECVFVDDLEPNCTAADEVGMRAVQFRSTEQAIADVEALLAAE